MSRLFKNILSLTFVQLISYSAPIIVLPYLSRVLSIESFGLSMILISIILLSLLLTDFGFNLYTPSWIAQRQNNKKKISRFVSSIFLLKSILFLVVSFAVLIYINFFSDFTGDSLIISIVTILAIFSQTFQITWLFQGIEKMANITFLTFLSKLSYIVLILLMVKDSNDVNNVILAYAISNLIATIFGIIIFYKAGFFIIKVRLNDCLFILKNSFPFFLSRASVSIYTSASTFIIGSIAGLTQAALFSSAEKLYQAGQSVSFPISQALYPYLSRTKSIKTFYRFMMILVPPLIISISIIFNYANEIIVLFYGQEYSNATSILQIFLITTVVNFISVNFGYPAFSIINRLDIPNKSVIFSSIIQLVILFCLYTNNNIDAKNIAISILVTESFVMIFRVYNFFVFSKKVKNENR
uniref:O-antigen flippase n=1 Tax=Providencia alcalifaciens TaxID=126385 RepID=M9P176_9GAMM|nr:O-antigen flippase [Providencia alcalifaciens]